MSGGKILSPRNYEKAILKAKQIKPLRFVFCVPGNSFSNIFVPCILRTAIYFGQQGWGFRYKTDYTANIFAVRTLLMKGSGYKKKEDFDTPFFNEDEYDYMMWIDSDMVWVPEQIHRMLNHKFDICTGVTQLGAGRTNIGKSLDEDYLGEHGIWEDYNIDDIRSRVDPFECAFAGFAFILIKRGVFEKVGFPWFKPRYAKAWDREVLLAEDISFCLEARDKGFKVMCDPTVELGHEKPKVLGGRFDEPTW